MRILLTGSSGFIGSNLRRCLQDAGYKVAGIDLRGGAEYSGGVGTLLSYALSDFQPDVCVHLAAMVTRARCEASPHSAIHANAEMTAFVARECARHGVRLAYASTSEVYGDHGDEMVDEETWPRPTSGVYGMTKLWGEQLIQHYCHQPLIMRLCMAYGPDMEVGSGKAALPTFIHNAIHGQPITVHRGASRSWCYIDDMARAMALLVAEQHASIWNVGRDDEEADMRLVALDACVLAGASMDLFEMVDPPPLQTAVKRISCRKLAREVGWQPKVDLKEGMRRCYEALVIKKDKRAA